GLKEKLLAALRGGLKTVLIPKENEKDLADIPANVKRSLEIIPVATLDEVLRNCLKEEPSPLEAESGGESPALPESRGGKERSGVITH
ncbi:S16 family serine protease, partial [Ferruginivarius sediminum]